MVRRGHVPLRTCAGCGRRRAARELVRFAVSSDGRACLALDADGLAGGRGVWVCPSRECLEKAQKRDSLKRRSRAREVAPRLVEDFIDHITDTDNEDGEEEGLRDS
ncbi:MAG: YlxR family protein [Gaiellales bacterium]|nr:MAG: YlxR family protein [Gaiellales bacterium]